MENELRSACDRYSQEVVSLPPDALIGFFLERHPGKVAFSSSLGAEDQVLTHMLAATGNSVKLFTLDTGRLFQETYELLDSTIQRYQLPIEVYFPHTRQVENMVNEHGINLFYQSIENRKLCCHIRKIEPLKRALEGMEIWISGIRREQSVTRVDTPSIEWDADLGLIKVHPLIDWKDEDVWHYIREHKVPYNTLHDKGYPSIGCLPCTRAILPGEDVRAGRWWWELPDLKECGLHILNK
ncbi:MAG: phosphoadenylyl-sulfate reductase [Bacteroidetes bacterium]|nr:MAG: phosphoadenylyl-sulfate reductase [Bacteroidota bacterium]